MPGVRYTYNMEGGQSEIYIYISRVFYTVVDVVGDWDSNIKGKG